MSKHKTIRPTDSSYMTDKAVERLALGIVARAARDSLKGDIAARVWIATGGVQMLDMLDRESGYLTEFARDPKRITE